MPAGSCAPRSGSGRSAPYLEGPSVAYDNIGKHRVIALAAGVTFYSILALFPAIAALVSLYGLFADPATIASHLDTLSGVMPGGAVEVIGGELKRVGAQPNDTLGFAFAVGLGTALWSANAGIKALFDVLNLVRATSWKAAASSISMRSRWRSQRRPSGSCWRRSAR